MKDGADGEHFGVVVDTFQMSNLHCEQPRSHRVIEEIRFGKLSRIFQRLGDKRRIGHADACYQTCAQNFAASLSRALSPIGCSHVDVNRVGHLSSLLPSSGCPNKPNEIASFHLPPRHPGKYRQVGIVLSVEAALPKSAWPSAIPATHARSGSCEPLD